MCSDREQVLENVRAVEGRFPEVEGIELVTDGDQVLLGVRSPDFTEMFGELLEEAIFNVFTIREGLIVRMEEFKTREQAAEAMRAHREVDGQPSGKPASRTPLAPARDLIPLCTWSTFNVRSRFMSCWALSCATPTVQRTAWTGRRLSLAEPS